MMDLQSLISATPEGGTLRLTPGTYEGGARVRKRIHIIGGFGSVIRGGADGIRLEAGARDSRFERLVIQNADRYNVFVGAHGFVMDGCRVLGAGKTNLLTARGVSDLWVNKSLLSGAKAEHNIYLSEGGYNYAITDCDLLSAERCGIQVNACPRTAQGVLVSGNRFRGNRSCAFQCSGLWGGVFEGNQLSGNRRDWVVFADQRKPQCLNADLDFTNQHGRLHLDAETPDLKLGASMVVVRGI
jgi:hypothetical protein